MVIQIQIQFKKGGQVVTALLYSSCNGYVIFEYNDTLYTKNDSE